MDVPKEPLAVHMGHLGGSRAVSEQEAENGVSSNQKPSPHSTPKRGKALNCAH